MMMKQPGEELEVQNLNQNLLMKMRQILMINIVIQKILNYLKNSMNGKNHLFGFLFNIMNNGGQMVLKNLKVLLHLPNSTKHRMTTLKISLKNLLLKIKMQVL